jgi:hypothetical protein
VLAAVIMSEKLACSKRLLHASAESKFASSVDKWLIQGANVELLKMNLLTGSEQIIANRAQTVELQPLNTMGAIT